MPEPEQPTRHYRPDDEDFEDRRHASRTLTMDLKVIGALVFGGLTLFGAAFAFMLNMMLSSPKEALADMSTRVSELRARQDALESRSKQDLADQRRDTNETLRAINQNLSMLNTQVTTVQVKLGIGMAAPGAGAPAPSVPTQ